MVNRRSILVVLGLFVMLVFSSCGDTSTNGKQSGYDLSNSFNGGTDGLKISFDENMPPEAIKDQGLFPFQVRVMVENLGEYTVEEGRTHVKLTGFDPAELNLEDPVKSLGRLNGVRLQGDNVLPGGIQSAIFSNLKYLNSIVSGSYNLNINANVCYPYETSAVIAACVSGNTIPTGDENYKNCDIEGDKKFANSGAPVKIENVKQFSNGESSIQIQFDIVHAGSSSGVGKVFAKGSLDSECNVGGISPTSPKVYDKENSVIYTVETGISGLDCESTGTNSNKVTLSGERYTVFCVQDTNGQGEGFEKLFKVKLEYDYLDRISKSIRIEHIQK